MITDEALVLRLRRMHADATPGDWSYDAYTSEDQDEAEQPMLKLGDHVWMGMGEIPPGQAEKDADLIVTLRNNLEQIIGLIEDGLWMRRSALIKAGTERGS